MRVGRSLTVAFFLSVTLSCIQRASAADDLQLFEGVWVSVQPPGPHVVFYRIGGQFREASLPIVGQASISASHGENGSNFQISGEGFSCYYFILTINSETKMVWELKSGSSVCFASAVFERADDQGKMHAVKAEEATAPNANPIVQQSVPSGPSPISQTKLNLWLHNGSKLELRAAANERRFYYYQPSDKMAALVSRGTLLFSGRRSGDKYYGTIRRFHPLCGPVEYRVEGDVFDDKEIVLNGTYPRLDSKTCQVVVGGDTLERLTFVHVE